MIPYLYYPISKPSAKEYNIFGKLQMAVHDHKSGGSFNMLACASKGKHIVTGRNRLDRPANTVDSSYPEFSGFHAELDLWWKYKELLKNSTIYIVGAIEKSDNPMNNTRPCMYCSAILIESNVKRIIYRCDGDVVATNIRDIEC